MLSDEAKPIVLEQAALEHAQRLAREQEKPKILRLYLDGKGCDGFYYGVSFDSKSQEDIGFLTGDVEIVVDPDTLPYVSGSRITWVDDERGKGFLVENPNHRKFRGKFYRSKRWKNWSEQRKAAEEAPTQ